MTQTTGPRSATTGEPVAYTARRNRLGIWLCIVSDAGGTLALLISYIYLWSLNVNSAWAPPKNAWADPIPFWLITIGAFLIAGLLWWGVREMQAGRTAPMKIAGVVSLLIAIATFVGQIVQLSTFPFGPSDGAYASATFWLCISAGLHLSLIVTLVLAVIGRTRAGLISPENPYHARLVAMYATWGAIAIFLGALFATTMTTSPNTGAPPVGDFQQAAPTSSAAPSPAASGAAAPAASSAAASPSAS